MLFASENLFSIRSRWEIRRWFSSIISLILLSRESHLDCQLVMRFSSSLTRIRRFEASVDDSFTEEVIF